MPWRCFRALYAMSDACLRDLPLSVMWEIFGFETRALAVTCGKLFRPLSAVAHLDKISNSPAWKGGTAPPELKKGSHNSNKEVYKENQLLAM